MTQQQSEFGSLLPCSCHVLSALIKGNNLFVEHFFIEANIFNMLLP